MRFDTYLQTVDYLFERLPMFSRIGVAAMKIDLTNIIKLCTFLGNPQQQFKTLHIAGTNGKGSVSHMLAAILQHAGYKTGLHTSPHLKDFRERIKINGIWVPQEFVVQFTNRIQPLIEEINPSFFEISVAMSFEYFAQQKVDIAVIEVGLGGRLDSTNIIVPELSIITSIGMDHLNLLGNTLEKIAAEKAGIIKQSIPVVVGEIPPETKSVFIEKAKQNNAPIHFATENRSVASWDWKNNKLLLEITENNKTDHAFYKLDLLGIYQTKNVLTVLEACSVLKSRNYKLSDKDISEGLNYAKKITGFHGRWEIIHEHPLIVLDVAHNEDGIHQLLRQIEITSYHHLHIILGFVNDKEIDKILALLPIHATYYFTQAQIPRALPVATLHQKASSLNLIGESFSNVNEALQAAKANASKNDLLLVCGSVYLVGEVN